MISFNQREIAFIDSLKKIIIIMIKFICLRNYLVEFKREFKGNDEHILSKFLINKKYF